MSKNTGTSELINYFTLGASGAVDIGGNLTLSTIANATTDTDKFLVSDTGIIKYRTGAELLTDIGAAPAVAGGYVPYTGAGANVDLGVYDLTANAVNVNGSGSSAGVINLESNTIFSLVNGYGTIGSGTTNQFNFYQTTGAGVFRGAILSLNSITASATRTFTLPDADGTLALTSSLGAYLPLAGGTLTGALNGTSASFTDDVSLSGAKNVRWGLDDGSANARAWGIRNGYNASGDFVVLSSSTNNTTLNTVQLQIARTGAATFSNDVTVHSGLGTSVLNIGGTNGDYASAINFIGNNTFKNWQVGSNTGVQGSLEIRSSTVAGGTSFTTPVLSLASTGAATFSSSVAIGGATTVGKLDVKTATANIPALGTLGNGFNMVRADGLLGMSIGWENAVGSWYWQGQRTDSAVALNLALQPLGGNVLIGTTSDNGARLQVNGTLTTTDNITINNSGLTAARIGASSSQGFINLYSGSSSSYNGGASVTCVSSDRGGAFTRGELYLEAGNASNNTANGFIQMLTGNAPRMTITYGGNVGIGTDTPTSISTFTTLEIRGATGGGIKIGKTAFAQFNIQQDGTDAYLNNTANGHMFFLTNDAYRVMITNGGILRPYYDNTNSLGASGARWSEVWAANGTIQTSDEREKKDIIDSDLGLDFVNQLRPVSFKWKVGQNVVTREVVKDEEGNPILDEEGNEKTESVITPREGKRTHYGLIAQEVEKLLDGKDFGGFIHDEETDTKGLRYDQFVPLLIKAIQEQQKQIQELKNKLS